jgi:hypothetical protein
MVDLRTITGGLKLGGFVTALTLEACFGMVSTSMAQGQQGAYGYPQPITGAPSHIPVPFGQPAYPQAFYPQAAYGQPVPYFIAPANFQAHAPCPQCMPNQAAPAAEGETGSTPPEGVDDGELDWSNANTNEYDSYPEVADLSSDASYAGGSQSAAPHMIGDFFGPCMPPIVVQPPAVFGPTVSQSIEFAPVGGNAGENTPSVATNGQPVEFAVIGGTIGNVVIPATVLESLVNFEATGVVTPANGVPGAGDSFVVGSFDPAFQDAIRAAIIELYGPGTVTYTGGTAEFNFDNGGAGFDGTSDEFYLTQTADFSPYILPPALFVHIPNPSGGGAVGRVKISENNAAMPVDRVYFDMSWFHNPCVGVPDEDVVRFSPGFESTFVSPITGMLSSLEMRFPMASTVNSTIIADGVTGRDTEFGNVYTGVKTLVHQSCHWAVALGLGVTLPTGDDVDSQLADGTPIALIENESVHVIPYWAVQWTPNEHFFAHLFVHYDFETHGNSVFVNPELLTLGNDLVEVGQWNDQVYQFIDAGIGKWVYRHGHRDWGVTGLAWTAELHYARSLNDGDEIRSGLYRIGSEFLETNLLNATVGGHLQLAGHTTATLGYAMPVTSDERVFDGEMRVFLNRRF